VLWRPRVAEHLLPTPSGVVEWSGVERGTGSACRRRTVRHFIAAATPNYDGGGSGGSGGSGSGGGVLCPIYRVNTDTNNVLQSDAVGYRTTQFSRVSDAGFRGEHKVDYRREGISCHGLLGHVTGGLRCQATRRDPICRRCSGLPPRFVIGRTRSLHPAWCTAGQPTLLFALMRFESHRSAWGCRCGISVVRRITRRRRRRRAYESTRWLEGSVCMKAGRQRRSRTTKPNKMNC